MDKASLLGLLIGFGGILVGNLLEGGHTSSLMQFTALVIVVSGTMGAVMVSSSEKDLKKGLQMAKEAFFPGVDQSEIKIEEIVQLSRLAKKQSLLAIEGELSRVKDPLLKSVLRNVVDGVEVETIREIFETQIHYEEESQLAGAKVWIDAGGFAPTIGIIGAVLGLIHVMGNLTDTSKLGGGIAVAFVATVYGVSFANLLFLPLGNKLKKRAQQNAKQKQMVLEGALLIAKGLSPVVLEQKLQSFILCEKSA